MAVNLVSPGVKLREIDLTLGRIDAANDQIAAFAGPFQKGPVDVPVLIQTESDLISVFGKPSTANNQNAYWLTASNYLSYGGIMRIVRVDSSTTNAMGNSYVPVTGIGSTGSIKVKSIQDYNNKVGSLTNDPTTNFLYAAKNPGTWGNNLVVHVIDSAADQIISGINTDSVTTVENVFVPGAGLQNRTGTVIGGGTSITGITTTGIQVGQVIICDSPSTLSTGTTVTGIGTSTVFFSPVSTNIGTLSNTTFDFGTIETNTTTTGISILTGYGVSIAINDRTYAGVGKIEEFNGYLKGIITGIGNSSINVKILSRHNSDTGESDFIEYSPKKQLSCIQIGDSIQIINNSGNEVTSFENITNVSDWYDQQTLTLGNSTVYWRNVAERPGTSEYVKNNKGRNDEINIVVVDSKGTISGNPGEILEKFQKLSKASDGKVSPAQPIYYKDYIRDNSNYLFVGVADTASKASRFSSIDNYATYTSGNIGNESFNTSFNVIGNKTYEFDFGTDYLTNGTTSYGVSLSDVTAAYSVFENPAEYNVNYIISGPSGGSNIYDAQAKASYLMSIAEKRKDCIAVISAYESGVLNQTSSTAQTDNIIEFFNGLPGSTYAVFDSGYKYTYDRFNNQFLYLACNSDVAGLMARTSINQYPWYSPAGASRGTINNAIKLAYNPSEAERDLLYTNRINPIIVSPGQGTILYGDKTASSYVSAFDRINVRKLFLTIEKTIESAARSQLFEFNDAITRSNFVNVIDPYLRDVKTKRGITDYLLVCDESNNTPDIIDSNQFRADIFIKPARSINFINLTFVATRSGVSFSEVVGNV